MPGDVHEITSLIHEYAFRLDTGDLDGVAELFAHAEMGSCGRPERARGVEGARANYGGVVLHGDGTPRTHHLVSNVAVRVDGDVATARSYFTVLQQTEELPLQPIVAGVYHDRFERVDGTWRFTERLFDPRLVGDLSHHLRPDWQPDAGRW